MKYYLAPMEGITGYIYRQAYHRYFHNVDRYFTPFITPHTKKSMNAREINDLLLEHNEGMELVPQILTNQAEYFIQAQRDIKAYGYDLVNLNLGCPSGTVAAKKKGAGFLGEPEDLDHFLEAVFSADVTKVSIKTRIGVESAEEWPGLVEIYNKYPLEELIVHPRVQIDFYKKPVHRSAYQYALENSKAKLCYNGDLFSKADIDGFSREDSKDRTDAIMLGRGILRNPGLPGQVRGGEVLTKERLKAFHDDILAGYEAVNSGDRNTLFKMKELWFYLIECFEDGQKYLKKIKKTQHIVDYRMVVSALFLEKNLRQQ